MFPRNKNQNLDFRLHSRQVEGPSTGFKEIIYLKKCRNNVKKKGSTRERKVTTVSETGAGGNKTPGRKGTHTHRDRGFTPKKKQQPKETKKENGAPNQEHVCACVVRAESPKNPGASRAPPPRPRSRSGAVAPDGLLSHHVSREAANDYGTSAWALDLADAFRPLRPCLAEEYTSRPRRLLGEVL